jgi:hypothetical protein
MDFYLRLLVNVLEILAFILVIKNFRRLLDSSLRFLIPVISFICITECTAFIKLNFFSEGFEQKRNFIYYNITTIIILLLYYGLFIENIRIPVNKKIFKIICLITFCFYIINVLFIQTGQTFHTYSFTIGSICLCLGIIFYIKEIIESDKIVFISKDPLFWISVGLFAFYIINIPYFVMYNYLAQDYFEFLVLCKKIFLVLNYFMYSSIIIGLLCLRK